VPVWVPVRGALRRQGGCIRMATRCISDAFSCSQGLLLLPGLSVLAQIPLTYGNHRSLSRLAKARVESSNLFSRLRR
jgi:hypothetical protein